MNLNEAKTILTSVGYNVTSDLDKYVAKTIYTVLESLESQGKTFTDTYQILSEMARKRIEGQSWNAADEALRKLISCLQSKMSNGGEFHQDTLNNWKSIFTAATKTGIQDGDELVTVSNPRMLGEIENIRAFLNGETDIYKATTKANTGVLTGNVAKDLKNIANSISSYLSKGTGNYDTILNKLETIEEEHPSDLSKKDALMLDRCKERLEQAKDKWEGTSAASIAKGRTAVFTPSIPLGRAKMFLDANTISYQLIEDGKILITNKVAKAKEVLNGKGTFETAEMPAAAPANLTVKKYIVNDEDWFNDIVELYGVSVEYSESEDGDKIATIKGRGRKVDNFVAQVAEGGKEVATDISEDIAEF